MPNLQHICPRCGYDLTGHTGAWAERCDLTGVCSECGLGFRWGDLLNPRLNVPRWSFEHTPKRFIRCFVGGAVRALLIVPLWRRLDIANPVECRRLVVLIVLMLLSTHLAAGAANAWYASGAHDIARHVISPNARFRTSPSLNAELGLKASARPFRTMIFDRTRDGTWVGRGVHTTRTPFYLWLMVAPVASFPIAFMLLWQTRRSAQIRPEHALRIGAYSLAIMPVFMLAWAFRDSIGGSAWRWYRIGEIVVSGWALAPLAVGVWLSLYWLVAIKIYLRLRAWFAVWLATTAVAAVASAVVLAVFLAA